MSDDPTTLTQSPACLECRREWFDAKERWRLFVTSDDPAETLLYCPACASREFDD
jgi:hypothetical protein